MKIILILTCLLLVFGCEGFNSDESETEYKQVYYDCYHVSQEMFKKISKIDYKGLKVEDMCNEDTSFLPNLEDEICLKACVDAFNHYK